MLVLIRHGKPEINGKYYLGHTEVSLSETGKEQMRRVASLCPVLPDKLWVSPSIRCMESADIFLEEMKKRSSKWSPEIEYREGLREINLGSWEGRSFEEIRQKYPLEYKERGEKLSSYRIQGGETFEEVQARAVETLREILREPEKKHVLITHLGVMRTLNCWIEKIPLDRLIERKWDYAEMLLLSADDTERIRRGL